MDSSVCQNNRGQDCARQVVIHEPEDDQLFRGGVPQPSDWMRAWQVCQSPVSYRSAQKAGIVENFVHGVRRRGEVTRKAFAAMVEIMCLVLRAKVRQLFTTAFSITICLDDRGPYRLLRYKCDTPRPSVKNAPTKWSGSARGCLGVLRRGGVSATRSLEDLDEDYSRAMAESVVRVLRRVARDEHGVVDEEFLKKVFLKIRVGLADGTAVQKCLRFLATLYFPNMFLILRDRAHIARNSTRDPLLAVETFEKWWNDIFGDKHALVPDMKNSDEWREKLLICQRAVLSQCGAQGGGVSVVSKVMSFAKQRFDSCATPQRQFCCMLAAIAMVLAYQASDARNTSLTRARAGRRLRELPEHVLTAGLSASYSEECIRFVRCFDVDDHDPAITTRQKQDFARRMQLLFFEGHIWVDPQDVAATIEQPQRVGGVVGVAESQGLTCLSMIWQQAKNTPTIYYGEGRAVHLYSKPDKPTRRKVADAVHAVVDTMLDRMDAELPADSLDNLFSVFDLVSWFNAFQSARTGDDGQLVRLRRHLRNYVQDWGFKTCGVRELESAACVLCRQEEQHLKDGKAEDNRIVWYRVLEPSFVQKYATVEYQALPNMIRLYHATLDTTGSVERGLGKLTEMLDAHSGPMDEDGEHMSQLMEVYLNGPKEIEELATRPNIDNLDGSSREPRSCGVSEQCLDSELELVPTDLTREFTRTWVSLHGRRFRVYTGKRKTSERKPKVTMAALARKTAVGSKKLCEAAPRAPAADRHRTVLGAPRSEFVKRVGLRNPVADAPKLVDYRKLSETKRARHRFLDLARARARASKQNPFSIGKLNPNKSLRLGTGLADSARPAALRCSGVPSAASTVRVVNMTGAPLPNLGPTAATYHVQSVSSDSELVEATLRSHMVVWRHSWELDRSVPDSDFLKSAFLVIAAGKAVLGLGHWKGERPHESDAVIIYAAAVQLVPATIVLCDPLLSKHRGLCQIIDKCGKLPESKWSVHRSPPAHATKDCFRLATLQDARVFLQAVRRVRSQGAAGAYFLPKSA